MGQRTVITVVAAAVMVVVVGGVTAIATMTDPAGPGARSTTDRTPTTDPGPERPRTEAESGGPPFSAAAYDDWLTQIPDDFPVATGLPDADADVTRSDEPVTGEFCAAEAFPTGRALDTSSTTAAGPELWDARDLRLFRDDVAAHRFVAAVVRTVTECPEEADGSSVIRHDVRRRDLGEGGLVVVRTHETDGLTALGATFWHVVRAGNAVLLAGNSGEYMPGETLGAGVRDQERRLGPVVRAMCVFSADPC